MKHKSVTKFLGVLTAAFLLGNVNPFLSVHSEKTENGTIPVTDSNRIALLGMENPDDYFLGAASQFSVFLHGDFTANESDCEGRLAAGGNANLGTATSYSVGARLEEGFSAAKIIIGGDTLLNFEPGDKKFVMGQYGTVGDIIRNYMDVGSCEVYEGELIDFDAEFALLTDRSSLLAGKAQNTTLEISPYYTSGWKVYGTDSNLNVLTLDSEALEIFDGGYLQLEVYIPEGSYLVINVPGESVQMPMTNVKVYDTDGTLTHNTGENMPILYNLPDAVSFHYTGSIQGSTLAPSADATGDHGGHVAGATIAKSFVGSIEFGYSAFDPSLLEMTEETAETTTAAAETTTTEAATTTTETTTTTEAATTTTETTTTTEAATTTTETTTTTEATTTTTTTTTEAATTTETTTSTTETTTTTSSMTINDSVTDIATSTETEAETTETDNTATETAEAEITITETAASETAVSSETSASTTVVTAVTTSATTAKTSGTTTNSPDTGADHLIFGVAAVSAAALAVMLISGKRSKN